MNRIVEKLPRTVYTVHSTITSDFQRVKQSAYNTLMLRVLFYINIPEKTKNAGKWMQIRVHPAYLCKLFII